MSLKSLLETGFFPFINRPARYVGSELGSVHKSGQVSIHIALAYCDSYDQGMSSTALHAAYRGMNAAESAACERVFAPDSDAEQILRDKRLPLFSMESFSPVADFDLILALIPGELCLTNFLNILDLAHLELCGRDRNDSAPLVGALVPPCFNPEPIADFVDFVILADFDAVSTMMIETINKLAAASRAELLRKLSQIKGIYVPRFYEAHYEGDKLTEVVKTDDAPPAHVAGAVTQPSSKSDLEMPIVPFEEISHDHLAVPLVPGAGHNCRFCPAITGSTGKNAVELANDIQRVLSLTGFSELSLLANCSSDYRHFDQLVEALSERLRDKQVRVNLPPLKPSLRTLEAVRKLSAACGKPNLSFLLESGSDRLREVMGRFLSIDEFYQVVANAIGAGWQTLKLYFTVGLPAESQADIDEIVAVVRNCLEISNEYGGKASFQVALSPFIPKAHTHWQWEPQLTIDDYLSRVDYLRRRLRGRNIQVSHVTAEPAYLEGAIARGDRRTGRAIQRAFELGCRFDKSAEHFDFVRWQSAFAEVGLQMGAATCRRELNQLLPWDHIEKSAGRAQLAREMQESLRIEAPARTSGGFKLGDLIMLKPELADQILAPVLSSAGSFGRKPKRKAEAISMVVPRSRLRLNWSKEEPARFVGHLATMRVFERAIRRADLPVGYTQGVHPRQKLAFGPPLTLGYTSQAEYLDVQLETPFQQEMLPKLNQALPPGFKISKGKTILGKASSLSSLVNVACYEVTLADPAIITSEMVEELLAQDTILISRTKAENTVETDIRKSVMKIELRLSEGINIIYMELAMGNLGFVKPEEILGQCFHLSPQTLLPMRVCRTQLLVDVAGRRLTPFEVD